MFKRAAKSDPSPLDVIQSELNEVRIRAEGWYQVAEQRLQTITNQARMLDQNACQIEGLRRSLDEAQALIESKTGLKSLYRSKRTKRKKQLA